MRKNQELIPIPLNQDAKMLGIWVYNVGFNKLIIYQAPEFNSHVMRHGKMPVQTTEILPGGYAYFEHQYFIDTTDDGKPCQVVVGGVDDLKAVLEMVKEHNKRAN